MKTALHSDKKQQNFDFIFRISPRVVEKQKVDRLTPYQKYIMLGF